MATKKPTSFLGFVYNKSGGLIGANDRIHMSQLQRNSYLWTEVIKK